VVISTSQLIFTVCTIQLKSTHILIFPQDHSIDPESADGQIKRGTRRHLLESSRDSNGKILNALDNTGREYTIWPYATDDAASQSQMTDRDRYVEKYAAPLRDLRWNLGATKGAIHGWHEDADGFATVSEVLCGDKLWMVGDSRDESERFAKMDTFLSEEYNVNTVSSRHMSVEGIRLSRNMCV
jgi:hypothetical protein